MCTLTGQLDDKPTRGQSRCCLVTQGLDISRTGQFEDWSTRRQRICKYHIWIDYFVQILHQTFWRVDQSASYPVHEVTRPRLDWPRGGLSANCPVTICTTSHVSNFFSGVNVLFASKISGSKTASLAKSDIKSDPFWSIAYTQPKLI